MNIVRVGASDHLINHVHNGKLVLEKYNFTTGFLTERAWKCQKQSHEFEFDVWNSFVNQISFSLNHGLVTRIDGFFVLVFGFYFISHHFFFFSRSAPIRMDAECSFNLPVCDLTQPGTQRFKRFQSETKRFISPDSKASHLFQILGNQDPGVLKLSRCVGIDVDYRFRKSNCSDTITSLCHLGSYSFIVY